MGGPTGDERTTVLRSGHAPLTHRFIHSVRPEKTTTMASIIARCVPGSYDTLEDAAKGLAHATLACALLGTVGYLGTGYCAGIVAMQCLLLSAMANRNAGLLKVCVCACACGDYSVIVVVRSLRLVITVSSFGPSVRPLDAFVVDWITSCACTLVVTRRAVVHRTGAMKRDDEL